MRMMLLIAIAGLIGMSAMQDAVTAPSESLVERFHLSPLYRKSIVVSELPIIGSAKVSDVALLEAAYLIRMEIGGRLDIVRAMAANRVRFVVMAPTELTTDVVEHSDLTPRRFWNRRARGLGATTQRPAVSCGEENLLCLRGDPYATENILIHEFAHAIHEMGLSTVDPTFDGRLLTAYDAAKVDGLWKGTYAMENRMEYWAEGAQSWFDTNRANDREHGPIDTRDKLKAYDPRLAALLTEVFGDRPWRYVRADLRAKIVAGDGAAGNGDGFAHLAGFDPAQRDAFVWPKENRDADAAKPPLAWISAAEIPSGSLAASSKKSTIEFVNRRDGVVAIDWIDSNGQRKHYADVRPGSDHLQDTFVGHLWVISQDGTNLGAVIATDGDGRVEIK